MDMILNLLIICFCINVFCSKGEVANAFLTRNNYTWTEAKSNCTMIGQENFVNISNSIDRQFWIDARVTYSPWIEYLGCSRVTDEIVGTHQYVTSGQQIEECLHICTDYDFLGLQQGRCACLKGPPPNSGDSDPKCDSKGCEKDDNGLCVDTNDIGMYAVYSKPGKFSNNLHILKDDVYKWSESFLHCLNGTLARYSVVSNQTIELKTNTYYWLANIRRPSFHFYSDPEPEPKYCGSAKISSNVKLMRSVEKCDKRLPALCLDRPEFVYPDKDNTGLNVSITVVVLLVGSVVLAVFIVVIVCRVRLKKKQLSLDQPHNTSEDGHEYTEINETAEYSIKPPERVNEQFTYDHLSHSQKVTSNPPGNIYDTTTDVPAIYYDQSSTVKSSYDKINISKNTHGNFQNRPPNEYDSVRLIENCDEDNYHHLDRNKGNVTTNFGNDYIVTSFVN